MKLNSLCLSETWKYIHSLLISCDPVCQSGIVNQHDAVTMERLRCRDLANSINRCYSLQSQKLRQQPDDMSIRNIEEQTQPTSCMVSVSKSFAPPSPAQHHYRSPSPSLLTFTPFTPACAEESPRHRQKSPRKRRDVQRRRSIACDASRNSMESENEYATVVGGVEAAAATTDSDDVVALADIADDNDDDSRHDGGALVSSRKRRRLNRNDVNEDNDRQENDDEYSNHNNVDTGRESKVVAVSNVGRLPPANINHHKMLKSDNLQDVMFQV